MRYKTKIILKNLLGEVNIGHRARRDHFFKEVKSLNIGKEILDAGCGTGEYILELRNKYPNSIFEGIELSSEKTIQLTNQIKHFKNVKIIHGSLTDFSVRERYDFIYCIDVLEHIKEDKKAITNLCVALKPSGTLYIHVPAKNQKKFFKRFKNYMQHDHVRNGYESKEIVNYLRQNGLQIVKIKFTMGLMVSFVWGLQKYFEIIISRRLGQIICYPFNSD